MPRLAVVGYASIDEIRRPREEPVPTIGGGAVYAALSAARMGVEVGLHIAVGEDFPDDWMRELVRLGVDVAEVLRRPGPTRRTHLRYGPDEERLASAVRDPGWWERTRALRPPVPASGFDGYLVCPVPPDIIRSVTEAARGAPVVADTSEAFASEGPGALAGFAGVGIFAPSLDEVRLLSREADEERGIARLLAVLPVLVVKKGRRGLSRHERGGVLHYVAEPVDAVDPTGAGDATVGALAAAILLGLEPRAQLAVAAAAGRLAIGAVGPAAFGWRA